MLSQGVLQQNNNKLYFRNLTQHKCLYQGRVGKIHSHICAILQQTWRRRTERGQIHERDANPGCT
jgi:hypothetical protein